MQDAGRVVTMQSSAEEKDRRDRRKDELLQGEGYFVLRFLAEDVMADLGMVVDRIVRHLPKRI